ncbi:hypothetical protein PsorP6_002139 [Peronosclerospora sorghi]|uniref:Uncharacterized protein n=1 Tax=Peronosclerospora sorghi TaxID=230839 RepID=A0ACC0WXY4_9STRA|nr:hypothetical protein PsorP6_002139 [Peronosclerospora sorghi]
MANPSSFSDVASASHNSRHVENFRTSPFSSDVLFLHASSVQGVERPKITASHCILFHASSYLCCSVFEKPATSYRWSMALIPSSLVINYICITTIGGT